MSTTTSPDPVLFTAPKYSSVICLGVNEKGVRYVDSWRELLPGEIYVQLLSPSLRWKAGETATVFEAGQITITQVSETGLWLGHRVVLLPDQDPWKLLFGGSYLLLGGTGCAAHFTEHYTRKHYLWSFLGIDPFRIVLKKSHDLDVVEPRATYDVPILEYSSHPAIQDTRKLSDVVATTEPVTIDLAPTSPQPQGNLLQRFLRLFVRRP